MMFFKFKLSLKGRLIENSADVAELATTIISL